MSFSSTAKEDLVKIRLKTRGQRLAQLAGLIHTCGALYVGRGRGAAFTSETLAVGKHISSLASSLYRLDSTVELSRRERRRPLTLVTLLGDEAEAMLLDSGLLESDADGYRLGETVPGALLADEECRRAFLRGGYQGGAWAVERARLGDRG